MAPAVKQRCTCEVYQCVKSLDPNPMTQVPKPGRLLPASTVHQHRRDDKIWRAARQTGQMQLDVLVADSSFGMGTDDSVVSSRILHGEAGNLQVAVSQPVSLGESTHTSVSVPSRDASAVSTPVPRLLPQVVPSSGYTHTPLESLGHYRTLFNSAISTLSTTNSGSLVFLPVPSGDREDDAPPGIDAAASRHFVVHQQLVGKLLDLVKAVPSNEDADAQVEKERLTAEIREHQVYLDRMVGYEWLRQRGRKIHDTGALEFPVIVKSNHLYSVFDLLADVAVPLLLSILAASTLHLLSGLSRQHSNFLLAVFHAVVISALGRVVADAFDSSGGRKRVQEQIQSLGSAWPTDIRTAVNILRVDPELHQYVCCSVCFSLYGPFPEQRDNEYADVPLKCSHRATPTSRPCGAQLFSRPGENGHFDPFRRFWYQSLPSWIARFLSRADTMKSLRHAPSIHQPDVLFDIWDGSVFREFKGPDNRPFFGSHNPHNEVRLGFSLFVDWFNPFGNKQSGKHVSFGVIYMICNNLPVHSRYSIENVYLAGIIPGPKEPSHDQINHVLSPLVDDLLKGWSPGLQLTRTALHPLGCLVRCAVIPLVCDMLAARKTAGFAGLGSHPGKYCAFCLQDGWNTANVDVSSWRRRTWQEHVAIATLWKNAATEGIRQQIYTTFGIRWTELLRLPYWNPTRFVVVDCMHNFFIGDLQHHCRNVLGLSADSKPAEDPHTQLHTPEEQQRQLNAGINAIKIGSITALTRLRRGYIVALANANNVTPPIPAININPLVRLTKSDQTIGKTAYAQALIDWYKRSQSEVRCPQPFPRPTADLSTAWESAPTTIILNQTVLAEVWSDMSKTSLPSWMARAPRNFGSRAHGKLKADQWRTVCLVNLVISLSRIWGTESASERDRSLLHNYLSLVIAIRWATMRSTSEQHANIVGQFMAYYVQSTAEIFGPRALVFNNHASLHVPECLRAFGPAHGWWAFPFERYNGILERYNTNSKLGEMELTILKAFCRGSNLKALLRQDSLPDAFRGIQGAFSQYLKSPLTGTAGDGLEAPVNSSDDNSDTPEITEKHDKLTQLSMDQYKSLLECLNEGRLPRCYISYEDDDPHPFVRVIEPCVQERQSVKLKGVLYTCASSHVGNSRILFTVEGETFERAGEIQRIFTHRRASLPPENITITEFFFVLRQFRELSDQQATYDPYRKFPLLSTRLCFSNFLDGERVIRSYNIVSHFAGCPYESTELARKLVVLSLNRN